MRLSGAAAKRRCATSRPRLFEFEDLHWFPRSLRDAGTDYLRFQWRASGLPKPIAARLGRALEASGAEQILDLASGGGGPILAIHEELAKAGRSVPITLTDKFPNHAAFDYLRRRSSGVIDFVHDSVDATDVPASLAGFRTMFAAMHHFTVEAVGRILQDAVDDGSPIGLFDFSSFPSPPPLLLFLLGTPPGILVGAPFVEPFRWSRLFWTYVVPALPFLHFWDGQVSALRLHKLHELRGLVEGLSANGYTWDIGREPFPRPFTYVIGYPSR